MTSGAPAAITFGLTGGGTGGHAYPSLAVAEQLRLRPNTALVYYGSPAGPECALAQAAGIPYRAVPASQVRGRSPQRLARGTFDLWRGTRSASHALRQDQPRALFATGGYVAAPVGRAAAQHHIPILLFLPDVHPGWAVRFLRRYATRVACSVDASLPFLEEGRAEVTGYPLRRQFAEATREEGLARFGLDPALPTLLVTGGSLGAHPINLVIARGLRQLLEHMQMIHLSGRAEESWLSREREQLPAWLRERYHLFAYTEDMAWAMAAADLAVTRAGASSLGELTAMGLPAIVIPGAFSDQQVNADYLAEHGAAVTLMPDRVDGLAALIRELMDDAGARTSMRAAMQRLARPDAAARLAAMLQELAA